jgi:predicted aspartyl protease
MKKFLCLLVIVIVGAARVASAEDFDTTVHMRATTSTTFYVEGRISGLGSVDLMVDTGSGYTTINEEMLARLKNIGSVRYVREMRGRLANGSEIDVPVYAIEALSVGGGCWLRDVEAAVFPGSTRAILGLNALQRTAPFIFSFEPPRLVLSNCIATADATVATKADLAAFNE